MNYGYGNWFIEVQGLEEVEDKTKWMRLEEGGWVLATAMHRCRGRVKNEHLGRNYRIHNFITGEIIMGDIL